MKKGFSLLELILVLGIASAVSFMKFQDLKQNQEGIQADAVGQQIKQVGSAVNGYINIHYDKLSTLTSVSNGNGTDPGPRTCSASTNTCTITYQTLINEGLMPSSFNGINSKQSSYSIILKREGASPNFKINGLVTTNNAWIEGNKVRYDLLGKAMQAAGVDSGITKTTSILSGYSGAWSENATDYNNINKVGSLGYRVGYDSAMYSVFLRRDGTLPMTGDLNMGGQDINNAVNITASGTTTSGIIKSTGAINVGTTLNVAGITTLNGATTLANTLTVNGTSNLKGATTVSNNLTVTGNEQVNGTITSNNRIRGNDIYSNSETYTTNWFRTLGDGGIYFQKYGGGWNMTDSSTINAYGGKNIQTSGGVYSGYVKSTGNIDVSGSLQVNGNINSNNQVKGASVVSSGRTTIGEFLQLNGTANAGTSCSPIGLQGRATDGSILSCVNNTWLKVGSGLKRLFIMTNNNKNCFVANSDTGSCSCPGGITGQYSYLSGVLIASNTDSQCSGGQNDHCTYRTNALYACSN